VVVFLAVAGLELARVALGHLVRAGTGRPSAQMHILRQSLAKQRHELQTISPQVRSNSGHTRVVHRPDPRPLPPLARVCAVGAPATRSQPQDRRAGKAWCAAVCRCAHG
jgi:hypothetical protein